MTAEPPRAWWRDYWEAFTRSGVYDPATMAHRARMERLATRWDGRAANLAEKSRRPVYAGVVSEQLEREASVWLDAARELRKEIA